MIRIFAAIALVAFALASTDLAAPAQAHDSGKLHFHGDQLSHQSGKLHFHDDILGDQLADKNTCFHNCIEQNGADAKSSCAMQCGLAKGPGMGGPKRDCGTEYKNCRKGCGKDKDCKKACRAAKQQCY